MNANTSRSKLVTASSAESSFGRAWHVKTSVCAPWSGLEVWAASSASAQQLLPGRHADGDDALADGWCCVAALWVGAHLQAQVARLAAQRCQDVGRRGIGHHSLRHRAVLAASCVSECVRGRSAVGSREGRIVPPNPIFARRRHEDWWRHARGAPLQGREQGKGFYARILCRWVLPGAGELSRHGLRGAHNRIAQRAQQGRRTGPAGGRKARHRWPERPVGAHPWASHAHSGAARPDRGLEGGSPSSLTLLPQAGDRRRTCCPATDVPQPHAARKSHCGGRPCTCTCTSRRAA